MTIHGEQNTRKDLNVVGYLPYYRLSSVHPDQLTGMTDLIYFSIEPPADGRLPDPLIPVNVLVRFKEIKRATGCRLLLSVGGWGRSGSFPALANDDDSRNRFIESLKKFCRKHDFDGVDFDWEHPVDHGEIKAYAELLTETRTVFQPHGLLVTVAQASWQDLGLQVYRNVDRVHLMSYDHDFPQATLEKSMADVKRLLGFGCPSRKIALGVPFYGRNRERKARTYRDLMVEGTFDPTENLREGYAFNGRETIVEKITFANDMNLNGIMIWEVGQDSQDPDISLLKVILSQTENADVRQEKKKPGINDKSTAAPESKQ